MRISCLRRPAASAARAWPAVTRPIRRQDQAWSPRSRRNSWRPPMPRSPTAAAANAAAWSDYCAAPDGRRARGPTGRAIATWRSPSAGSRPSASVRSATADTMERLYFWPERKNAAAKGLAALLAGDGADHAEKVARASAAAQGIPGAGAARLRRRTAPRRRSPGTADAASRACAAGIAIAGQCRGDRPGRLPTPGTRPGRACRKARHGRDRPVAGARPQQAASLMVTDFMTTLAVIQDQKVEPSSGDSGEAGRARPPPKRGCPA